MYHFVLFFYYVIILLFLLLLALMQIKLVVVVVGFKEWRHGLGTKRRDWNRYELCEPRFVQHGGVVKKTTANFYMARPEGP